MAILLADLRRALDKDELVPYFQPLVELRTGRLSGFEVLARWQHPTDGICLPPNLIRLAEVNGLIGILAQQVFSKALQAMSLVPGELRLSVNLSPLQLKFQSLAGQIEQMAATADFPLSRLTLEITESALLSDLTLAQSIAGELKELGCRLSLDDFGTGYSSLAHLQALPFNELKIDRSFVSQMTHKRESRKIVAAIIGLGHSLGLDTVAEGIESAEQADMLLWLGSELGQGWHFGRPAPSGDLLAFADMKPKPTAMGVTGPGDDWAVSSLEALPTQRLAQLQAIYDGAPVGLCFLDRDLRYVSMNQKLAEMNGASVGAHLGKTVQEMVPQLYPHIKLQLQRALSGEAIPSLEIPSPPHGNALAGWRLVSYQPAFDEADEVIGISISVMDVTEKRKAQDALHEAEFMQRQLRELNRQVPWVMDPEGQNLQVSSTWVTDLPEVREKARNLGWLEAVHPSDLKATIRRMKKALRTGEPINMEYRVQNTEGMWRWMRSRGLPRFGPDGQITRWYGSVEDIHETKSAADTIRKTEAKMRALIKAVPVAFIIAEGKKRSVLIADDATAASIVENTEQAPSERLRLVSMLEDFKSVQEEK